MRFDAIEIAGNIDAPEAGLDAIGQLALCDENVGWRDDAIRIILYFSDDPLHFAGEGRVNSSHSFSLYLYVCLSVCLLFHLSMHF